MNHLWLWVRVASVFLAGVVVVLPAAVRAAEATPVVADGSRNEELADTDYVVDFWRRGQGLPDDTVNALLQTHDGYLWIGTAAGLARFDGLVFTVIGDEVESALKGAQITALLEDRRGGLWIGTQDRGAFRLRGGQVQRFAGEEGLSDASVTSLAEDSQGVVWVATQGGLKRWEKGRLAAYPLPGVAKGEGVVALHAGRSGALWITTRLGVFRLQDGQATPFKAEELPPGRKSEFIGAYEDRSGDLWVFGSTFLLNVTQGRRFNYFRSQELASSRVWTICEQSDGTFWVGTSGRGLYRFHHGLFHAIGVREGLDQSDVRALYADGVGNLWIGTSGNGLARLRAPRVRLVNADQGLNSKKVTAVAGDQQGGVWIGTADAGLWHWNGKRAEPFGGGPPLSRITQIQSLCLDPQGAVWVGTWGAGLLEMAGGRQRRLGTADGLSDDVVLAVTADPAGDGVWAGTLAGALHRIRGDKVDTYLTGDGLTGRAILCLLASTNHSLFVGSEGGGLVVWDGAEFSRIAVPPEANGKPIRCLYEDRKGGLWVGTWGAGAFCRRGEKWTRLSQREGLGADNIGHITQDEQGHYWVSTDQNVYRLRAGEVEALLSGVRQTLTATPVLVGMGLESLKCAQGWPGVAPGPNGAAWLATSAELLPLAAQDNRPIEPPPPVILERLLVNGQNRAWTDGTPLRLGPGVRSLDFEFTAVNFTAPSKVRFRHKLVNYETDWVEGDTARRAHYGPLPPGEYQFQVIAANAEGGWNDTGANLALVVTPPLWRAWWFLTLSGAAIVAGIWAVARFISTRRLEARLRAAEQRHAMERERARIARDMHDEIGSKLTRISFLSEVARQPGSSNNPARGPVEAIAHTSRELLQALDEIVWAVNPRNDNLEQLAGYLEQHAREYLQATALECVIQVPAQLPPVPLSAELRHNVFLAFEEALNNTLKHAHASRVSVVMKLQPREFVIEVQDDGRGFKAMEARGTEHDGLRNMRNRLESVGGDCQVDSKPGGGATVTLRFPLISGKLAPA